MNEDITNNANVNDEKPFYTEAGFKAIVKQSPFNMLQRDQYEYKSADSKYYILAYHEDGLDGIIYTHWSKYRFDNDEVVEVEGCRKGRGENYVIPHKEFIEMIDSEEWDDDGSHEVVVAQ
jgi:hypothetical protein